MKKTTTNLTIIRNIFGIIALVAVMGVSFATLSLTGCDDDDDSDSYGSISGGSWDAGKGLKGTSWVQRYTSGTPGSSMYSCDYTYTITFTSDDTLTITKMVSPTAEASLSLLEMTVK